MIKEKLNPYCESVDCKGCGEDWMCRITNRHVETIRKLGTTADVDEAENALKDINSRRNPRPMEQTGNILSRLLFRKTIDPPTPSTKEGQFCPLPPGCRKISPHPDCDTQLGSAIKGHIARLIRTTKKPTDNY